MLIQAKAMREEIERNHGELKSVCKIRIVKVREKTHKNFCHLYEAQAKNKCSCTLCKDIKQNTAPKANEGQKTP